MPGFEEMGVSEAKGVLDRTKSLLNVAAAMDKLPNSLYPLRVLTAMANEPKRCMMLAEFCEQEVLQVVQGPFRHEGALIGLVESPVRLGPGEAEIWIRWKGLEPGTREQANACLHDWPVPNAQVASIRTRDACIVNKDASCTVGKFPEGISSEVLYVVVFPESYAQHLSNRAQEVELHKLYQRLHGKGNNLIKALAHYEQQDGAKIKIDKAVKRWNEFHTELEVSEERLTQMIEIVDSVIVELLAFDDIRRTRGLLPIREWVMVHPLNDSLRTLAAALYS